MADKSNTHSRVFLVQGKRTPFGKFGGSLKDITPVDLAVSAAQGALAAAKLGADKIEHVILGNVVPSSTDTMYGGRHLALKLGCNQATPGYVVNRLCGSGIQAILDAFRMVKYNEAQCVLAAGTENMSMIPHLTYGARFGTKYGSLVNVDMLLDALTDKLAQTPMGITAEKLAGKYEINRQACDAFALDSHHKAKKAYAEGHLQGELVNIELKYGSCNKDEHLREDVSLDEMSKLKSSFVKDGVVTPANASGIVDGAGAVIVASEQFCHQHGLDPLVEITAGAVVGVDPTIMGIGPVPAIQQLLKEQQLNLSQIDLVELNEAFAGQALSCVSAIESSLGQNIKDRLNIWGGAIALGHPLGASGVRVSLTLARQLKQYKKKMGIASACIGGGQGIAVLLKTP